ncbi:MAG: hypothetical protein ACR2PA_24580 [Hyphomicrobiaceae bacterium]
MSRIGTRRFLQRPAQIAFLLTASAAVALVAAPQIAMSADLGYDDAYSAKPTPYDDPRYADLYGSERKSRQYRRRDRHDDYDRYARRRHEDYGDTYDKNTYDKGNYDNGTYDKRTYDKDAHREYLPEQRYAPEHRPYARDYEYRRKSYYPRRRRNTGYYWGPNCVPRPVVLRRLIRKGWHGFHDLEFRGPRAKVSADRDRGGRYRLTIDRCSGHVLKARRIHYRQTYGRLNGRYSQVPYSYK